jgi:hypothetical protein
MASLQSMALGGNPLNVTGGIHQQGGGCTPWTRLYHCGDCPSTADCNPTYSGGYLHIRTPIPCESYSTIRNVPLMFEIMAFHTYSGEYTSDFKFIINIDGSDNLESNGRVNAGSYGLSYEPFFYKSSSTYGGYKRLCFSVQKIGCCCVGWIWMRWWGDAAVTNLWNHYSWGQTGAGNRTNTLPYF